MGELLGNARVIDQSKLDTSQVSILTKVRIKNKKNGMEVAYTIVAEEEADLKQNKISIKSPIGQGLMGKKPGETAIVQAPAGQLEFEIIDISI